MEEAQHKRLYIIPFISHSAKGPIIGKENKAVVVKGREALLTTKRQSEGIFKRKGTRISLVVQWLRNAGAQGLIAGQGIRFRMLQLVLGTAK